MMKLYENPDKLTPAAAFEDVANFAFGRYKESSFLEKAGYQLLTATAGLPIVLGWFGLKMAAANAQMYYDEIKATISYIKSSLGLKHGMGTQEIGKIMLPTASRGAS